MPDPLTSLLRAESALRVAEDSANTRAAVGHLAEAVRELVGVVRELVRESRAVNRRMGDVDLVTHGRRK